MSFQETAEPGTHRLPSIEETNARVLQLEAALRDTQTLTQDNNHLLQQIRTLMESSRSTPGPSHPITPNIRENRLPPINELPSAFAPSALRPAPPNEFDGTRDSGKAFLTSCRLYFSLCGGQLPDHQVRIHWALTFMKTGRAATFAQWVIQRQALSPGPVFATWDEFEEEFRTRFCPQDEEIAALTKLEGTGYYQNRQPVSNYIDRFEELITAAGYTEGRVIVMKFRKGLDKILQDRIAEMGSDRPPYDDPQRWYDAARRYDANRAANQAFHAASRGSGAGFVGNPSRSAPFLPRPSTTQYTPPPGLPPRFTSSFPAAAPVSRPSVSGPVPMEVDNLRKHRATPGACYRCGSTDHLVRDCPRTFDVRAIPVDEQILMLEQLLAAADLRAAGIDTEAGYEISAAPEEAAEGVDEGFGSRSE